MLTGLRAFSAYVPRSLVARLVRTGDADATQPREAILTVMFTDITGFTTHFGATCPPLPARATPQPSFRACCAMQSAPKAARSTSSSATASWPSSARRTGSKATARPRCARRSPSARPSRPTTARRSRTAGQPLRVRIGIHTGPVIVGNIGAADRVNYTIVGDTVNVSQRLQELGKLLAPDAETAIVISGETAGRLDEQHSAGIVSGRHRLRGRGEPIDVFLVEEFDATGLVGQPASHKVAEGM